MSPAAGLEHRRRLATWRIELAIAAIGVGLQNTAPARAGEARYILKLASTAHLGLPEAELTATLAELYQAMAEGLPVKGYMHWSLIDNFEWGFGYRPKYGLHSLDRTTFKRTPKPSTSVLSKIARRNAL